MVVRHTKLNRSVPIICTFQVSCFVLICAPFQIENILLCCFSFSAADVPYDSDEEADYSKMDLVSVFIGSSISVILLLSKKTLQGI